MTTDPDEIRRDIERTRGELSGDVDALTGKVNPRRAAGQQMDRARGRMAAVKERVMGSASHAGDVGQAKASSAAHQASSAAHQVSEKGASAREAAGSAMERQRERTQGSPLAAGLVAFGLGVLVSSLLPPSEQEKRVAGQTKGKAAEHSGEMKQQASATAHQMQDNLRQPAREAVDSVKSRAAEGASAVREQGRGAAGELRGQSGEAAENIRRR